MSEVLIVPQGSREDIYEAIIPQIESLISTESDITANLANIAAVLKEALGVLWVGFYIAKSDNELVLGPFQGPLACTRIKKGNGVCGTVFANGVSVVVDDVEEFHGHIACSSSSRSEVVVPILVNGNVWGVIDIDSELIGDFSQSDKIYLERVADVIVKKL